MAKTSVGAIYATNSKLLQRVYIPHADDNEIEQQHVGPGESIRRVPLEVYRDGGAVAVQTVVGTPLHSGRCAVVHRHTKQVIDVIMADPDIYQHPDGHHVVQHDQAGHGDVWDGAAFHKIGRR